MSDNVKIIEKHPRAIRWCHWINFPLIMIMIWSGVMIYWANPAYIPLPDGIAKFFGVHHKLAEGMGWHFTLMWPFAVNGLIYLAYLIFSGEWREIAPNRQSIKQAIQVALHDLHIRKEAPVSSGKFNGAQKIAYTSVLILAALAIITGIAIHKPVQASVLTELLGGYEAARLEHFIIMLALCGFFVMHLVQVTRAGWNNFRAMVAGYEVENDEH
jgi:thiosulfate reductase cytochrome b subunit